MPPVLRVVPRGLSALLAVGLCLGAGGRAAAQSHCEFGPGSGTATIDAIPGNGRISHLQHPHFVCDDGVQIWADSAVSFSAANMSHLMGNVRYQDSTRVLTADDARYFSQVGRLQAFGHLFLQDTARGSLIRNGQLVYFRKTDNRDREEMTVTTGPDGVRPTALLSIRPSPDTTRAPGADTLRAAARDTTHAAGADTSHTSLPDTLRHEPADTAPPVPKDTAAAAPPVPRGPPPVLRRRPPVAAPAPRDTTPYLVVADRMVLRGESYFQATGSVDIARDSLRAFADTARYEETAGRLLLEGKAKVHSSGYDLSGETVDISLPGGEIRRVRAEHAAKLVGSQLEMTAPRITVFMTDGQMDRLVATPFRPEAADSAGPSHARPGGTEPPGPANPARLPPGAARRGKLIRALTDTTAGAREAADTTDLDRPVATSEKFRLTADSLDVRAPGQVLDKMYAVGDARGESSSGDSLNVPSLPEVARSDWIMGDTLISTFAQVKPKADAPHDSVRYELKRLVAKGDASTLYRIAPTDSTFRPGVDRPAVHYVLGSDITIVLDSGRVSHMDVVHAKGWHLEPLSRAAMDSLAADSARAHGDTARARADTAKAKAGGAKAGTDTVKVGQDTAKTHPDTLEARPAPRPARPSGRASGGSRRDPPPPAGEDRMRASPSSAPGAERRGRR